MKKKFEKSLFLAILMIAILLLILWGFAIFNLKIGTLLSTNVEEFIALIILVPICAILTIIFAIMGLNYLKKEEATFNNINIPKDNHETKDM